MDEERPPAGRTSRRLFVSDPLAAGTTIALSREQGHYLTAVLRLGPGAPVLVFNGRDGEFEAQIAEAGRKSVVLTVLGQRRAQPPPGDVWLLFAPLKAARLDYMAQKAVEMGAARIQPVITRRTIVSRLNTARLRANAIEAAEQCGVLFLPEIAEELPLLRAVDELPGARTLILADEEAPVRDPVAALSALPRGAPVALLIGPEGGFDEAERTALLGRGNVLRLSLGPRVLRADTAAVAALALVQAVVGDGAG